MVNIAVLFVMFWLAKYIAAGLVEAVGLLEGFACKMVVNNWRKMKLRRAKKKIMVNWGAYPNCRCQPVLGRKARSSLRASLEIAAENALKASIKEKKRKGRK